MRWIDRFNFKDIESSGGKYAGFKRLNDRIFVHDAAPCTIDDVAAAASTVFADVGHGGKTLSIDEVVRFICQITMNGNMRAVGEQ